MKIFYSYVTLFAILANISFSAQESPKIIDYENDKAFREIIDEQDNKSRGEADPFAAAGGSSRRNKKCYEYSVSKGANNKANLLEIYSRVATHEAYVDFAKRTYSFRVLQRIDSKKFLVTVGDSTTYLLESNVDINAVDGEWIKDISIIFTDDIYEYESVIGAKRSVKIIKIGKAEIKEMMTKEEFIEKLKGGATWRLKNLLYKKCAKCFGTGKLGALDGYKACEECGGHGGQSLDCIVKW
jgi:hypothetical protein